MNEDARTIRRMLEEAMAKGRSNVETAGVALWLDNERERQGLLSEQTRQDAEEVILGWLRADAGDRLGMHEFVARELADYLTAHVDFGVAEPLDVKVEVADLMVEAALQRWREERQR
jgi:hypothetical protein